MPAVPQTPTICSISANPCGTPSSVCSQHGAGVSKVGAPQAFAGESLVAFDVDSFEMPPDDAQAAFERIVVGEDTIYTVHYAATYTTPANPGSIRTRIKVNGITVIDRTDPIAGGNVPLNIVQNSDVALNAGDILTVTVAVVGLEGASVVSAELTAINHCGPATDVIEPQG